MLNPLLTFLLHSVRRAVAPKLNVTIIYECVDSEQRAKALCDQLAIKMANERALTLNSWDFRVLGTRDIRNAAASTAAAADLVIFSMDGRNPLPAKLEKWIAMWTWLIDGHKPAVVALFAALDAESAPIQTYLRGAVAAKKLDLFPSINCSPVRTHNGHELSAPGRTANAR